MNKIQKARKIMRDAFNKDPSFQEVYVSNIAMLLYDRLHAKKYRPKLKPEDRNAIAKDILNLLFYDGR
jgi:hypothetical protein